MKVYLAGPMTGKPDWNFPLFNEVAGKLRAKGHTVFNPSENDEKLMLKLGITSRGDIPKAKFMELDLDYIVKDAEWMVVLPGWEKSAGASAEYMVARWKGIQIFMWDRFYETLLEVPERWTVRG